MLPSGSWLCSNRPAGQIGLINDNDDGDDDDVLRMARRRGWKIAGEDALCGWWGLFPMITMIKMRR